MKTITPQALFHPCYDIISDSRLPWPPENMMTLIERKCVLATALQHNQGLSKLEIGTYEGFMTGLLAKVFPETTIYTVDIPPEVAHHEQPGRHLGHHYKSNRCENVVQLLQDSNTLTPEQFPPIDFGLVDGDHSYESVVHDFTLVTILLVKGGGLLLDDCFMDGPKRFIEETSNEFEWTQIKDTKLAFTTKL